MKWFIGFLLFPLLSWAANCDGLKQALETCSPYSCDIEMPMVGKVGTQTVVGREGDICIYETEMKDEKKNSNLGQVCHIKTEGLAAMAESTGLSSEMQDLMINSLKMDNNLSPEEMTKSLGEYQAKMQDYQKRIEESNSKYLAAHGGQNPCIPKDPDSMSGFLKATKGLAEAVKPLATEFQTVDNKNFERLFPDKKGACIVSTELNSLNSAQKIPNISTQEECKKLESATCSELFEKAKLPRMNCPLELNVFYAKAENSTGENNKTVPATPVKIVQCELNGLMKSEKKTTYDPDFKKQSKKYCEKVKGYQCTIRLLTKNPVVELESTKELIKDRDGAEVVCLKKAKRLAAPHCESPERQIVAEVALMVDGRTDLNGIISNETYPNFCYTHRLKRVFR